MNESTHRIRAILVKKLQRHSKKSWKKIARECHVHPGSIKRWLAGERVRLFNIQLLAESLETTADKIILPDGEEDLTNYVEAEITVDGNLATLPQPNDVTAILEAAQKAIGSKYRILLMYVGEGSIKIGIKLHGSDAVRLARAFVAAKLQAIKITSITLASPMQEQSASSPTTKKALNDEVKEALLRIWANLSPEQRDVLAQRSGLDRGSAYTHDEISFILKPISRQLLRSFYKIIEEFDIANFMRHLP